MKLVNDAELSLYLPKMASQEELMKRSPQYAWNEFHVSNDELMSQSGHERNVMQRFSLPSHRFGWEAPLSSDQTEEQAEGFIELLKNCGCPPTCQNHVGGRILADFWFDMSSEGAQAYYRLMMTRVEVPSGTAVLLITAAYRPFGEMFDPAVMRNMKFLDIMLGSIARFCGVKKLTR